MATVSFWSGGFRNVHGFIWAVGIPRAKEKDPTEEEGAVGTMMMLLHFDAYEKIFMILSSWPGF